jgi:hypothetical protein
VASHMGVSLSGLSHASNVTRVGEATALMKKLLVRIKTLTWLFAALSSREARLARAI